MHGVAAGGLGITLVGGMHLDRLTAARHHVAIGLPGGRVPKPAQTSTDPFDAVQGCTEDRGALIRDGTPGHLIPRRQAGGTDRGADGGHCHGAAMRWGGREVRVPNADANLFDGNAECLGGYLRHRRVGARPHVACGDLDCGGAVGVQSDTCARRAKEDRIGGGCHPHADQQSAIAH
jgi:hypothetical protein